MTFGGREIKWGVAIADNRPAPASFTPRHVNQKPLTV